MYVCVCVCACVRARQRERACILPPLPHQTLQTVRWADHCVLLLSSRAPTNESHWTARTRDVTRAKKQDGSQCLGKSPQHAWLRYRVVVARTVQSCVYKWVRRWCCSIVPRSSFVDLYQWSDCAQSRWKKHAVFLVSTAGHEGLRVWAAPRIPPFKTRWVGRASLLASHPNPYPADLCELKMDTSVTRVDTPGR